MAFYSGFVFVRAAGAVFRGRSSSASRKRVDVFIFGNTEDVYIGIGGKVRSLALLSLEFLNNEMLVVGRSRFSFGFRSGIKTDFADRTK